MPIFKPIRLPRFERPPAGERRQRRPKRDPFEAPFVGWDLEANDWNSFRVGAWADDQGAVEVFPTLDGIRRSLYRRKGRAYAHYCGRYDDFFMDPPPSQLVLSGSGILSARFGETTLVDSWFTFQAPLAKVAESIGMEKFEGKSDRVDELSDQEVAEHCANDALILATALKKNREWVATFKHPRPRWPSTSGGIAIYVFEALEPDHVAYLAKQVLSLEEWDDQAAAVSGGRVEVHHIGETPGRVYAYDLNSSYPFSWLEAPLPMGPWVAVDREVKHLPGVYECEVRQHIDSYPVVAPDYTWKFSGRCWCTSEELEAIRSVGGEARVLRGYASRAVGPLGQRFVAELYAQKLAGVSSAKLTVNAPHGKASQGLEQRSYYRARDGRYLPDVELQLPAWFQRPLVGAFILARARVRLWRVMERLREMGYEVYYCDTDCIHTDCPPERFPAPLGSECGAFKLEADARRGLYVAPKVYALLDVVTKCKRHDRCKLRECNGVQGLTDKVVCKGFPAKAVTIETLYRAARGERVGVRLRAGLKGFLTQQQEGVGWGAHVATLERTLCIQRGGKHHGSGGRQLYIDYGKGARWRRTAGPGPLWGSTEGA